MIGRSRSQPRRQLPLPQISNRASLTNSKGNSISRGKSVEVKRAITTLNLNATIGSYGVVFKGTRKNELNDVDENGKPK